MKKISKGEQKIIDILNYYNIPYKREMSFTDLRGKKKSYLRFDFAIFKNNQLFCLIEYDGEQHFNFTPFFHKKLSDFKRQQEWDRRKNEYCIEHNILLIRIPYWDLDNITLNSIFSNSSYVVKDRYHIDNIKWGRNI